MSIFALVINDGKADRLLSASFEKPDGYRKRFEPIYPPIQITVAQIEQKINHDRDILDRFRAIQPELFDELIVQRIVEQYVYRCYRRYIIVDHFAA
jgi:hypothetical protein